MGALLAAFFSGMFVFLLIASLTGNMPKRLNKVREKKQRLTKREQRQSWLNQSGLGVTPSQFWAISIGTGIASFTVLFLITQVFIVAAVPAVLLGALPKSYFAKKRAKLIDERIRVWPDALRTLIAGISSSQSLHQALKALGSGGPIPLRPVFQKYSRLTQALDQKSALEVIKEDLADPKSDRIIEILISATEAGPGVVLDILRDLAASTTKDLQLADHIETMQVEQKLNARIVFVLPYILLVMMVTSSPIVRDFYQEPAGILVIIIGTGVLLFGMTIIQKLGKIPVEDRVFTNSKTDAEEQKIEALANEDKIGFVS
jgi:tight adherence protein B